MKNNYLKYICMKVNHIDTKQSNKRNNQNSKFNRQDYHMKQRDTNDRTTLPSMKTRGER